VRDRLLTLLLAAGALFAFYALFAPRTGPKELMTRPTSIERGPNGYLGLQRWLAEQGVATASMRDRYSRLAEVTGSASSGNLLLSTAPHFYPTRDSELRPLQDWISAGNTLLLVAGISDTPEWSMNTGEDPMLLSHLAEITGLSFTMVVDSTGTEQVDEASAADAGDDADGSPSAAPEEEAGTQETPADALRKARAAVDVLQRYLEPQRFEMKPIAAHPLLEGVRTVATKSEYPTSKFVPYSTALFLELARETDTDVPVLWLLPYGSGQIIVCAYGNVFTNKVLGEADNARLFANIVASSVRGQGKVIFDDAHQGLVAFYDPEAFFGDPRLHRSLWWLLGLWLLFVLGPLRLRAGVSRWAPLDITSFVRATGGFMARVLKPASAAQRLIRNFLDDVRRLTGLPDAEPAVWEWLRQHAPADAEQLRQLHDRAAGGRGVDLPRLQNLLVQLRASIK
jgi:hypothetical protein